MTTLPETTFRPDVVVRAREAEAKNEFRREVVKRTPVDLYYDACVLACGHTALVMIHGRSPLGPTEHCHDCCDLWMVEQEALPPTLEA